MIITFNPILFSFLEKVMEVYYLSRFRWDGWDLSLTLNIKFSDAPRIEVSSSSNRLSLTSFILLTLVTTGDHSRITGNFSFSPFCGILPKKRLVIPFLMKISTSAIKPYVLEKTVAHFKEGSDPPIDFYTLPFQCPLLKKKFDLPLFV